jgi:hypothetical protein
MKLRPNDLAEIKRIVGSTPPSSLRPGVHKNICVLDISDIMGKYGLNSDDAFDCAQRLVQLWPAEIEDHLKVDQRAAKTLVGVSRSERLADGRLQLHFPGERPLERFTPRVQWKPKDAIEMKRLMASFYESAFGLWMANESALRAGLDERYAQEIAAESRQLWAQEDLLMIFAKDSYLDMLEAAALTAPDGELNDDELLSSAGVMLFEHERNVPAFTARNDDVPIRGITWKAEGGYITVQVMIDGHHELNNPGQLEPPADCYAYLYQLNLLKASMRDPTVPGRDGGARALVAYLRSIKVIAQSAATNSTTVQQKRLSKKEARQARTALPSTVRVLSLRNADHGRYELDAATGRKVRQHWVRGHWRNQWYPSLNDNRAIWIDGYIKGDASLGTVTGQKIHVAR